MKRYIAAPYAKTSIMHPEVLEGIEDRTSAFLNRCKDSANKAMDVYIWLHCFALDCASFHLLHPYGTKSIEGRDLNIMKGMSFYDDRPGPFPPLPSITRS